MDRQLAQLGDEAGGVVLGPRRAPSRDQDGVGRCRCVGDLAADAVAIVGQGADHPRDPAVAGDQRREHDGVGVGDLEAEGRRAGGEQLVAGDDHRDVRAPDDVDRACGDGAEDAEVLRAEGASRREDDRAGRDVLAAAPDVPAGRGRLAHPDGIALHVRRFHLDDGVGPSGEGRPGRDLGRLSRADLDVAGVAGPGGLPRGGTGPGCTTRRRTSPRPGPRSRPSPPGRRGGPARSPPPRVPGPARRPGRSRSTRPPGHGHAPRSGRSPRPRPSATGTRASGGRWASPRACSHLRPWTILGHEVGRVSGSVTLHRLAVYRVEPVASEGR